MAQTRKDLRGRVLRKGESQRRSDGRYVYTYTDPLGRRKYVYAQDLVALREKEAQLMKDQMDGLDIYVAGKATVNFVFDRYMSLKTNLRQTTRSNYLYMYDRFIRDTFGKRNIAEIKYSDVVQFYNHLIEKQELKINTLAKSDFRAVKILECEAVPKSKKLLKFVLDDGERKDRVILSGIHEYYEPEELVGKTCVAITNLPPRKMMGIDSEGMLISAVYEYDGREGLNLLMLDDSIPAGAKLY